MLFSLSAWLVYIMLPVLPSPIVETVNSENNEITKRHNKKKAFTNETQNSGSDVSLE